MSDFLSIHLAGISMKNPLMTASGTFGFGEEFADFIDLSEVGAIVVKGITREPRRGNQGRRMAETPSGMLNCIGLQNPGVDVFLRDTLPRIRRYGAPIIANINGNLVEDYAFLAEALDDSGVAGLEVNISCPNTKHGSMAFGVVPETAAEVVLENSPEPVRNRVMILERSDEKTPFELGVCAQKKRLHEPLIDAFWQILPNH